MNIAFIVSGAEPGRDGMGDYTLSLAAALKSLGHSVLVVALNDQRLADPSGSASHENADGVAVEQFAPDLPWSVRIDRACARLRDFRPRWVSFQMSCYAYQRKGLLAGFGRKVRRLAAVCENWQVMFQELWVGFETGASPRRRLVGLLQRHFIKPSVLALRPRLLQTSTPLFQALLRTIGIEASVLPLAGSIAVNPDAGAAWFLEMLGGAARAAWLAGGFFGAIYPNWEPEPLFSSLRKVAAKTGRKVCIFAAGRMGAGGEEIWSRLPGAYPDFQFEKLGALSVERVSQYLQNLDFGIAATPWLVIGKSSATAAMLDHGLPVMVTRNDSRPRGNLHIEPPADPLLILADGDVSERFFAGLPRRAPRHSSRDLAAEFVRRLEAAESAPRLGS